MPCIALTVTPKPLSQVALASEVAMIVLWVKIAVLPPGAKRVGTKLVGKQMMT